jgi:hypothetical protein
MEHPPSQNFHSKFDAEINAGASWQLVSLDVHLLSLGPGATADATWWHLELALSI